MNSKNTTVGALMVATSALLFAAKGTLIKYIYTLGVSVSDLMILRLLFSAPIYLCVAIMHWPDKANKPGPTIWLGVVASGICANYLASYFDMLGLEIISVGLERVILYTYPAFVVIFSAWLFKRRLAPILLFYIALSYAGLFLVFYADIRIQPAASIPTTIEGSLYVLASAITFAIYVVGGERYMRSMSSALFTAVAMLGASGMMSLHYLVFNSPADLLNFSFGVYGWILLLAVLFTVVPAFMLAAGILRIGSAKAGGIGMIGPLGTLLIAALVLGETVTLLQVTGFAVVMFAIHRLHRV